MNFKRQRPRVNYPLMKKGGPHLTSRKKHRNDAKKETTSQISEVMYEKERSESETPI
jgi:hypothetical protein